MNNRDSLVLLFPSGDIKRDGSEGFRWFEVNGLEAETTPQNCEVIMRGDHARYRNRGDYQTHYLVKVGGRYAHFRVCKAMEGSGYDAYATGHFLADDGSELEHAVESVNFFGRD